MCYLKALQPSCITLCGKFCKYHTFLVVNLLNMDQNCSKQLPGYHASSITTLSPFLCFPYLWLKERSTQKWKLLRGRIIAHIFSRYHWFFSKSAPTFPDSVSVYKICTSEDLHCSIQGPAAQHPGTCIRTFKDLHQNIRTCISHLRTWITPSRPVSGHLDLYHFTVTFLPSWKKEKKSQEKKIA